MKINEVSFIDNLLPKEFIQRDLFGFLINDLAKEEMQIIYGPRQVGKSSLMYLLIKKIFENTLDIFYFNLDEQEEIFSSAELFIADILSKKTNKGRTYIFIDEIQRKKEVGLFLKYIYDRKLDFKFILTGSSSLSIKNSISEPLTGRKFEYFLSPVGIFEILEYKGIDVKKTLITTPDIFQTIDEFLLYGGYPQVVLLPNGENKFKKLQEIAKSYITRDLKDTFEILNSKELERTSVYLAQNIGNILSRENIAKTMALTVYKVEKHLEALEKSFVISFLYPFFQNPMKELSRRPKMYFVDNGIRNALIQKNNFNLISSDLGKLFEQTVFQILKQNNRDKVRYWRNINQTEVDFLVEGKEKLSAYEAKYTYEKGKLPKNLVSFGNIYKNRVLLKKVISRDTLRELVIPNLNPRVERSGTRGVS